MGYSDDFAKKMKEIVSLPKHVIFAIREAASDSYHQRSFELHNLLGEALTDFQNTDKKNIWHLKKRPLFSEDEILQRK